MIDIPLYTVSDVALFTGRSPSTIRNYLRLGKITPTTVDVSGYRRWSLEDLVMTYITINNNRPSGEQIASFLYDYGNKDEIIVRTVITKLTLRNLVDSWT